MRVDHDSSSVDAGALPVECQPRMVAVVRRRGLPCRGRRVGVPLIADLDLADGFDSAGTPERLETIGYLAVTDHAPRLRSQAAYHGRCQGAR